MFEFDRKVSAPIAIGRALVLAVAIATASGCSAGVKATNTTTGSAGSTGTDAGADHPIITVGTGGSTGGGGSTPNIVGTGGTTGAGGAGACVPTYTCDPVGGRYCNTIGNGCKGQSVNCGA